MVRSTLLRKLVAGLGTALIIAVSLSTADTLPVNYSFRIIISVFGATVLYVSVALALAIHRSYSMRHDRPKDMKKLYTEGPYELCRHPFYFFILLTQFTISLTLASLMGLFVTIALIPAWLFLLKIEERELIEYWGEKYLNYKKNTPALIPRLESIIKNVKPRSN